MQKEIWKDIPEYVGYYQASSLGRIRGVDRVIDCANGQKRFCKGVIMTPFCSSGYLQISMSVKSKGITKKIHKLIAITFLGHIPCGYKEVVDHIDGNTTNNNINNLRLVSNRANVSSGFLRKNKSSKYTGVVAVGNKWQAQIRIDNNRIYLGIFNTEHEASEAYQAAKTNAINGVPPIPKRVYSKSVKTGVYYNKSNKKWVAVLIFNKKTRYLGNFSNINHAILARIEAEKSIANSLV